MSRLVNALGIVSLVALAGAARADTVVTLKNSSEVLSPGQAQPRIVESTSTLWLSGDSARLTTDRSSVILNGQAKTLYLVDPQTRTYSALGLPIELSEVFSPEEARQLEAIRDRLKLETSVSSMGEGEPVAGLPCRKHRLDVTGPRGLEIEMRLCVTDSFSGTTQPYDDMLVAIASVQPAGIEWIREIVDLGGFPLHKKTRMLFEGTRIESTQDVSSIDERTAPKGTYVPPDDFAEVAFDPSRLKEFIR